MSLVCESFIYIYLGVVVWTIKGANGYNSKPVSWTFIFSELIICFFARAFSMFLLELISIW